MAFDRKSPSFAKKARKGWGTLKFFCYGLNQGREGRAEACARGR